MGPNWVGVFSSLHLRTETDPVSETSCFLGSRISDDGKNLKNPVILYLGGWSECYEAHTIKSQNVTKCHLDHRSWQDLHVEGKIIICRVWGSHSGIFEEFYFLGYNAVQSGGSIQRFGGTYSLRLQDPSRKPHQLWRWMRYVLLKLHFHRITRHYIPEDRTLESIIWS
jgi:hypothetical protein